VSSLAKVLIVEDEPKLSGAVSKYLQSEGFTTEVAADGPSGLAAARRGKPSIIVLDLLLPRMNGLEVTKEIRRYSDVPIILLSARSDESDKLQGLELGADDYITKPFSLRELAARIKAVLRRCGPTRPEPPGRIAVGNLELDIPSRSVKVGGKAVNLTPAEFGILALLMHNPGRVFTRLEILDAVFGDAFEGYERTVDTHVLNIRKIEPDPSHPTYLQTVYGVGYRFSPGVPSKAGEPFNGPSAAYKEAGK